MMPANWDELTEEQKVASRLERVRAGHCSVGRHQRQLVRDARERAFDEAIFWLAANGFSEAAAALEAAAFDAPAAERA